MKYTKNIFVFVFVVMFLFGGDVALAVTTLSANIATTGTITGTSAGASALAVGLAGATNPALQVDASTASSATGLKVKSAAAAGGLAVSVISSGANENLTVDAAGSGTITLGGTSTGAIGLSRAVNATVSLAIGGGTAITKIVVYAPTLTPAATAAAIQTVEQTFTVTGLAVTDKVFVNGPVPTSLCPPVTFRVSAVNTLAIGFSTLTAAECTPAAGTYNIVAISN